MGKIAVVGGSSRFHSFLKQTGAEVQLLSSTAEAIRGMEFDGMLLLPDYETGCETVPRLPLEEMELLAARKRQGFRVYAENYDSCDTYNNSVFGCEVHGQICHIDNETLCAYGEVRHALCDGRILQASGAAYLPGRASHLDRYVSERSILLKRGNFVGASQIAPLPVTGDTPVLMRTGSFYTSLLAVSRFDPLCYRPYSRWKTLYAHIFSYILGVAKEKIVSAFEMSFPPLKTAFPLETRFQEDELPELCRNALKQAVQWHFDSGIVLGDGKQGSVEMVMSGNGKKLYANKRVDAGFYTGWLLSAAGKYFNNETWYQAGRNVFEYFARRTQITGGTFDGLFTWIYNENAWPHDIYSIDSGRCGIALCNMYRLTGEKTYLEQIRRLAEGFCRWTNGDLIYSVCVRHGDTPEKRPHGDPANQYPWSKTVRAPGVYGEMVSFMGLASQLLEEPKYLDTVIRIADRMAEDYPEYDYHGHTTSAQNARLLMILLCIQYTGKRDYSGLINVLIEYLSGIQLPCGGIYCEDNITFERELEAGGGMGSLGLENGLAAPWEEDKISDQLYVVNNALAALSVLKTLPEGTGVEKEKGLKVFRGLIEYVLKIQIVSEDGRFCGGWMRAYSMTMQEYYGIEADRVWGAYCIMAGWIMGIIPQAIFTELTGYCPYVPELPKSRESGKK